MVPRGAAWYRVLPRGATGYLMVTWWLHGGYMVVTWWLHGGYMVVTHLDRLSACEACGASVEERGDQRVLGLEGEEKTLAV